MRKYRSSKYSKKFSINIRRFYDMESSPTKNTVMRVGVSGTEIFMRCSPFLQAFKYFRVNGVKISMLPASTLPADPSQISYEGGENSVNPTDMMNVGLMRFTNGENLAYLKDFTATQSTSDVDTNEMQMYYNLMLDNRWGKFALQKGFKTYCKPLVWDDGLPAQFIAPDALISEFIHSSSGDPPSQDGINCGIVSKLAKHSNQDATAAVWGHPDATIYPYPGYGTDAVPTTMMADKNLWRLQTGKFKRLGWRPTDECLGNIAANSSASTVTNIGTKAGFNTFPYIDMLTIILPRALKTKFAFRIVETISLSFAAPVYQDGYGSLIGRQVLDRTLYPEPDAAIEPITHFGQVRNQSFFNEGGQ